MTTRTRTDRVIDRLVDIAFLVQLVQFTAAFLADEYREYMTHGLALLFLALVLMTRRIERTIREVQQ